MPAGQGWPPVTGSGASPVYICRSVLLTVVSSVAAGVSGTAGSPAVPARADWMAMALTWARAVRAVCRLIAAQVLAWDWSQPYASFPVLNVISVSHR